MIIIGTPASGMKLNMVHQDLLKAQVLISVTSAHSAISGLTPESSYEVYVRANCGGGDEAHWSRSD